MSICIYCGAEIRDKDLTREHVLPKSAIKWGMLEDVDIKDFNKRGVNVFTTHKICNNNKSGRVLTESQIRKLFVSGISKEKIIKFHKDNQEMLESYLKLREHIYNLQKGRCFECGDTLHSDFSLRRPIHRLPRSKNNCVGLCCYCTDIFGAVREKYARKGIKYVKRMRGRFD